MATIVRKTISLPAELARQAEAIAQAQGKTLSEVVRDALSQANTRRQSKELLSIQGYWQRLARQRGVLTERDLRRYLRS